MAIIGSITDMESEMYDHNLEDLIIEDPEPSKKKPKKIVTLIALIIIILVSGTMLTKMIFGNGESTDKKSTVSNDRRVDKELSPIKSPIKVKSPNDAEELPDELAPLSENPSKIQMEDEEERKSEKSTALIEEIEDVTQGEEEKPVANAQKEERIRKTEEPVIKEKSSPPEKKRKKKRERRVERKEHRKSPKPSELFKQQKRKEHTRERVASGRYYIQVGSFSKRPNDEYLDNIAKSGYRYITVKSENLVKIRIGPYRSYEEAKAELPTIKSKLNIAGFVVKAK